MKTKYCFIPDVENFTDETRVYAVMVGTSNRELAQCKVVDSYACKNGAFWRPWDQDTDNFLLSKGYYSFSYEKMVSSKIRSMEMNIPSFVKHIQNQDLDLVRIPAFVNRNFIHQLSALSPSFYMQTHAQRASVMCKPETRKNLSLGNMSELLKAAGGFCLILGLFLLGAYLDGIEPIILQY